MLQNALTIAWNDKHPQLNIFTCCTVNINSQIINSIYHRMYTPGNLRIVQKITPGNLIKVQKISLTTWLIVLFHHLEITHSVCVASEK